MSIDPGVTSKPETWITLLASPAGIPAATRAAIRLAGRRILQLNFRRRNGPVLGSCAASVVTRVRSQQALTALVGCGD